MRNKIFVGANGRNIERLLGIISINQSTK